MNPATSELHRSRPAPPVRIVHLGLGGFFRAHQAWYTAMAPDAGEWGIAAFSGRSAELAGALTAQDCLYTLVTRDAAGDRFDVLGSLVRAHPGGDSEAWRRCFTDPALAIVTLTVTEAGYTPDLREDLAAVRAGRPDGVRTAPGRLVAGLAARRVAGGGPLALVPCDNLPSNGAVLMRAVTELAELLDPTLRAWVEESVAPVTTMVDRITPRSTDDDRLAVAAATGVLDRVPVVTEPFAEWALSGGFPAGRPGWDVAGATFTDDVEPFERRKLWLLNGAHSLLAYAGSVLGAGTVAEAVRQPRTRRRLEAWWDEAVRQLPQPTGELAAYRSALEVRFSNPRIQHQLAQIAIDGSQKIPVRVLPTLRGERAAGRAGTGASDVVAAWLCHLRGAGAPVRDVQASTLVPLVAGPSRDAARRLLGWLAADLAADDALVAQVASQAEELAANATTSER